MKHGIFTSYIEEEGILYEIYVRGERVGSTFNAREAEICFSYFQGCL